MKKMFIAAAIVIAAVAASTRFSVGELMPSPTKAQQERLAGFAAQAGVQCEWKTPSVYLYLKAGRPTLQPSAVCTNKRHTYDPRMNAAYYVGNLGRNYGSDLARFFKEQSMVVGLRMSGDGAPLVCYSQQPKSAWTLCRTGTEHGCLFAKCESLMASQQ